MRDRTKSGSNVARVGWRRLAPHATSWADILPKASIGRRTVAVTAIVVGIALAASVPVYVLPVQHPITSADVVYSIGVERWRIEAAVDLIETGASDTLVVSRPHWMWVDECELPQDFAVICADPDPFTTRGEAAYLQTLMQDNGWHSAIVVTRTPHVTRTQLLMDRCVDGDVNVVGRSTGMTPLDWAYQYLYQTAAFVKLAFVTPGCA